MMHRFSRRLLTAGAAVAEVTGLANSRGIWLACAACSGGHHCGLAAASELALCVPSESLTGSFPGERSRSVVRAPHDPRQEPA
jgi:hypothetical protein